MDPGPRRKHKRTYNDPGHAHFLTYSCHQRLPLLTKDRTRRWVVESMRAVRERHELDLWAYVIMPEHVHLLLMPRRNEYQMQSILRDLKRPVSWQAKQFLLTERHSDWIARLSVRRGPATVFRFWTPGGGYDRNITSPGSAIDIAAYIHANPVRRGLVNSEVDWEWSSARFWAGLSSQPLAMDPMPNV